MQNGGCLHIEKISGHGDNNEIFGDLIKAQIIITRYRQVVLVRFNENTAQLLSSRSTSDKSAENTRLPNNHVLL